MTKLESARYLSKHEGYCNGFISCNDCCVIDFGGIKALYCYVSSDVEHRLKFANKFIKQLKLKLLNESIS